MESNNKGSYKYSTLSISQITIFEANFLYWLIQNVCWLLSFQKNLIQKLVSL